MSVINPFTKIFDSRNLQSWVNCDIQFELTTGEHLIGKLQSLDPKSNVFHFVNLRDTDGTLCYLTQNYSYRDFQGKFICITQNVSIDIDDFKVQQAEKSLLLRLEDKSEILEHIENPDDLDTYDDIKPEILDVPPSAEIEFESLDFDFYLDPEIFEGLSNEVVRFDSVNADKLSEAISILGSSSIVGFTCLPLAEDRETPIDFAIFGCDNGTFIFPIIPGMMKKLKAILESDDICKVTHNCCVTAARLYKLYKIDLNNVDDTLVWDCELVMRKPGKYGKSKQVIKPYHTCVKDYLKIDLPWADTENFYERCGKGKLLSKQLDETGCSYARSLVMLFFELRIEMLKHLFFPILMKQYLYLNNVKYISAHEYSSLKSYKCFSPYHLSQGEMVDVEGVDFSSIPVISDIISEKYKFYNVVFSRKTKSIGLQCRLETQSEKNSEDNPSIVSYIKDSGQKLDPYNTSNDSALSSGDTSENNNDISQPSSSLSSPLSPNSSSLGRSPKKPFYKNDTRYSHVTDGNISSAMSINHRLIRKKDNHNSPLNQPVNHDKLTNDYRMKRLPPINTNHASNDDKNFVDWALMAAQVADRPGEVRLYPAGFNY